MFARSSADEGSDRSIAVSIVSRSASDMRVQASMLSWLILRLQVRGVGYQVEGSCTTKCETQVLSPSTR